MAPTAKSAKIQAGPSSDPWKRIGQKTRAGVLVPLFSVYSKNSVGIGELDDVRLLVDWCVKTGNSIMQLLPMNEVGAVSCPYDSLSSFALEPAYISLRLVADIKDEPTRLEIDKLKNTYPATKPYVNYKIKHEKMRILWELYTRKDDRRGAELERFIKDNEYWIYDFATYKALKYHQEGKAWWDWEEPYKKRDKAALEIFTREHEDEIIFQIWVQFNLCKQFKEVKKYASSKKVFIKGDLPVLVSRDSADVWAHPEYFKLEFAAGAPPDMYCSKGQRWGMPTYNWNNIASDGYVYIQQKLKYAQNFYDILRIDHIVGLFRIWSIPYDDPRENEGLNGSFDPKDEKLWQEHGKKILAMMVKSTGMLLCGEDLGMIPKSCPKTMERLSIPGNDIQRWVKDWTTRHDFLKSDEYRRLSVAALSTHDTTNWAAWWESEAGTVDECLFERKCRERGIDFASVKTKLFDQARSRHGRLRWKEAVESVDLLVAVLARDRSELADFIDMYLNTYQEKEKLWKILRLKGAMKEKCDPQTASAALRLTYESNSIFCIQLITDLLYVAGMYADDPYKYRINTPGTIRDTNWSLTIPTSLESLLSHRVCDILKAMAESSGRI